MKPLFKVLLSVLVLLVALGVGGYYYALKKFQPPPNQLAITRLPAACEFRWKTDTIARPTVPHAGLLVPIALPGCPRTCYLQFDTGAPYSLLYARPLAALRARYPATRAGLLARADTVHNLRFGLGGSQVHARWIRVYEHGARALPADSTAPFIVGTLGSDVLDGRALVLDYARRRFVLNNDVPDSLARRADFVPLAFTSRRLMLTAAMQGQPQKLLFDTGSSAFALLTSEAVWHKLARPTAPVRITPSSSMGRPLKAHTAATAATVQLGAATLPLGTVTFIRGMSIGQELLMSASGMEGMLGNEPFSQRMVIFDVRGGRFGLVRP